VTPVLTPEQLADLGRTDGDGATLTRLAEGQHTRRMLLLRILLDAIDAADAVDAAEGGAAPPAREHAALLETAERTAPDAARRVLFYSLTGPWAERCVAWLDAGAPAGPEAARDLAHLGSLAAAAAIRAGVGFTTRVTVHDGRLTLPTLGALRCAAPDGTAATVRGDGADAVLAVPGRPAVRVRHAAAGTWTCDDPGWLPLAELPGGPRPVLLDDLDPGPFDRRARPVLPPGERAHWADLWRQALPLLSLGGAARSAELALLDCIVPTGEADTSGTTPRAFGAVLAGPQPGPAQLAAGLAHELQHAKLAALSDLVTLHTAGPERRHWAPWRRDPRPFDGLLHGTYAHLALAGFWQRLALALTDPAARDHAWAAHARCHAQVGAVLPVLRGSRHLTDAGRTFLDALADRHDRLRDPAPPAGHAVRAAAYVETARTVWLRQYGRLP
jgi:HEXXH motif-containing protein